MYTLTFSMSKKPTYLQIFLNISEVTKFEELLNSGKGQFSSDNKFLSQDNST